MYRGAVWLPSSVKPPNCLPPQPFSFCLISSDKKRARKIKPFFRDNYLSHPTLIASTFLVAFPDGIALYFDQDMVNGFSGIDSPILRSPRFAYCWTATNDMLVLKLESVFHRIRADRLEIPMLILVKRIANFAKDFCEILKRTDLWPQHAHFSDSSGAHFCCGRSPDLEYLCSASLPIFV